MFEIEIIGATLQHEIPKLSSYCTVKVFSKELFQTEISNETLDPKWNAKFVRYHYDFDFKENSLNRPFYHEYLEVDVFNAKDKTKIYYARISLNNIGKTKCYKLMKPLLKEQETFNTSRIYIALKLLNNDIFSSSYNFSKLELCEVLSPSNQLYSHLYIQFDAIVQNPTYRGGLPGPCCGEKIIDVFDFVEVIFIVNFIFTIFYFLYILYILNLM
jgi:hypothetical protein